MPPCPHDPLSNRLHTERRGPGLRRSKTPPIFAAVALCLMLAPFESTHATSPLSFVPSHIVTNEADLDGDGMADTLIQSMQQLPSGDFQSSLVSYSLDTGAALRTIDSALTNDFFGFAFAYAGDVNGDGADDVFVGAPLQGPTGAETGALRLISGATGLAIWEFPGQPGDKLGVSVAAIDDITGDGVIDVAVSSLENDTGGVNTGRVYLLSGADGQIVQIIDGSTPDSDFGASLTGLGDVDADGVPDLAIGQPGNPAVNPAATGAVFIYSGATGQLIRTRQSPDPQPGDQFGSAIAAVGDLYASGDGVDEFVVASPGRSQAAAYAFSGADGSLVYTLASPTTDTFGIAISTSFFYSPGNPSRIEIDTVGGVDANGLPTIQTWVYSAFTGALMFIESDDGSVMYPISADVNADGFVDMNDLQIVLDSLGSAAPARADATGDGVVDLQDVDQVVRDLGDASPIGPMSLLLDGGGDENPCNSPPSGLDLIGGMSLPQSPPCVPAGHGRKPRTTPPTQSDFLKCVHKCENIARNSTKKRFRIFKIKFGVCAALGIGIGFAFFEEHPVRAELSAFAVCEAAAVNTLLDQLATISITENMCIANCPPPPSP